MEKLRQTLRVRKEQAKTLYLKVKHANEQNLIESSHDISDGGMAVALVESTLGTDLGIAVDISGFEDLSVPAILFSESHSRFIVSVSPENKEVFESIMGGDAVLLGRVTKNGQILVSYEDRRIMDLKVDKLLDAWDKGLEI